METIEDDAQKETTVSADSKEEGEPMDIEETVQVADTNADCKELCVFDGAGVEEQTETKETTEKYKFLEQSKKYEEKTTGLKAKKGKKSGVRREPPLDSTIIYKSPSGTRYSKRIRERMLMP